METKTRVVLGTYGQATRKRFWMDGTADELFAKINGRWKTYTDRPTKATATKKTATTKTATKTTKDAEAVGATA